MIGVFDQIKDTITMQQVAERYGFEVKKGMMLCPFHNERSPSFKVYPEDRGWHCFGCGEGGSVIDFVAKLFGLSALDAAKRLDADFCLGLMDEKPDPTAVNRWKAEKARREEERKAREAERWHMLDVYLDNVKVEDRMKKRLETATPGPEAADIMAKLDYMNYWFGVHEGKMIQGRR